MNTKKTFHQLSVQAQIEKAEASFKQLFLFLFLPLFALLFFIIFQEAAGIDADLYKPIFISGLIVSIALWFYLLLKYRIKCPKCSILVYAPPVCLRFFTNTSHIHELRHDSCPNCGIDLTRF